MKKDKTTKQSADLRRRAEDKIDIEILSKSKKTAEIIDDKEKLIHELEVHQVELQVQNDELRITQQKLEKAKRKYLDLYELAPVGYLTLDETGNILELNLTATKILGLDRKKLINKKLHNFIYREDRDIFYLHMEKMKKTQKKQYCELKLIMTNGEEFYCHLECIPVQNEAGELLKYHAAIANITEQKQTEKKYKKSQERVRMMNKIIRHDIANDLAVIKSAINIYRRNSNTDMIDEIEARAIKSSLTISNYKNAISHIETHPDLYEIDLAEILVKLRNQYSEVNIQIVGNKTVYADETLSSVFENLITNSIQHGKAAEIVIEITSDEDNCKIKYSDNGKGIPDKIKSRIFDEGFYYGETGHTGVGLYIAKNTLERYGGIIFVEDNVPDGVIFNIYL